MPKRNDAPLLHPGVLSEEQNALLPLVQHFFDSFGLVGGTAVALQIGHRRSIDFDLCTVAVFDNEHIRERVRRFGRIEHVFMDRLGEYTIVVGGVKVTFFHYPFPIEFELRFSGVVPMADLLTLAGMKAYALGRRAKWKDYVDIFFVIKAGYSILDIVKTAKGIFGNEFNEKLFRAQLSYFDDIDYSEEVIFLEGFETKKKVIQEVLVRASVQGV
ncbi:MAG: nucleotidyl transferase AbiEii/AbiGii toxin family protein [Candidatus Magasanikbacteria bacterium]|nr:nucleotidyl transferase AbiEii/AbiGii toxin family protein [Candidatus Magasanikbacteria bacterium]